jgi:hypothetical protein
LKLRFHIIKCKNLSFDISLKNISGNGNVNIKVVVRRCPNYSEFRIGKVSLYTPTHAALCGLKLGTYIWTRNRCMTMYGLKRRPEEAGKETA